MRLARHTKADPATDRAPTLVPTKPSAGKRLVVTFPITRSDTGLPLTQGRMICDPSIAGKVVTHGESFANGTARLAFTVPKKSRGSLLKVHVTIKSGGESATRAGTFRIR